MKTLKEFAYHAPETIDEAVSLFNEHADSAKIFAGGTDLMVMLKDRILNPDHVIDIKTIPGLDTITWDDKNGLKLGALVKITGVVESPFVKTHYPALSHAASVLGSPQVRNKATIGGNVCRSSPSADTIPALMVYDARLTIAGPSGKRTVPIDDFFTGPGRNVLDGEILVALTLPPVPEQSAAVFMKISRVSEDLSKVNCAIRIEMDGDVCKKAKVVLGAVGPTPVRAKKVESVLEGQVLTDEVIEKAAETVKEDIKPIDDIRSTAAYRIRVGKVMIKKLVRQAREECRGA